VRLGQHKQTGEYAALKILKKQEIIKLKQVDHIISESIILSNIQHPFLVSYSKFHKVQIKMFGYGQDSATLTLVLEFIQGGELFTYLRRKDCFDEMEAKFFAGQVYCARFLHN